jgi:hypothetical protein
METATPTIAIQQARIALPSIQPRAMTLTRPLLMRKAFNPLTMAYLKMVAMQRSNAPIFHTAPNQTGTLYTAIDGGQYFISHAMVSVRLRGSTTPDVFIQRQASGAGGSSNVVYILRVTFELRRPDNLPDSAHPLPMDQFAISLQPASGEAIPFPPESVTVLPAPDGDDPDVVQKLAAQVTVDLDRVVNILQNDSQAHFVVTAAVHYQIENNLPQQPDVPPHRPPIRIPGRMAEANALRRPELMRAELLHTVPIPPPAPEPVQPRQSFGKLALHGLGQILQSAIESSAATQSSSSSNQSGIAQKTLKLATLSQFMLQPGTLQQNASASNSETAQPAQSTLALLLSNTGNTGLGAYFPKTLSKNRPIYAGVDSSFSDNPDAVWITSNLGYFKESAVPNQFYVLPDGYSLSFNIEKSLPDMSVLMTPNPDPNATGSNAYRIRVRFGIAPYLDAGRMRDMRAFLSSHLGVVYPDLVLGGYAGGSFEPTHLFDQLGSTVLSGAAGTASATGTSALQSINPAQPFEFILDCTMEFYTLLSKLLVSTDGQGLKGNVHLQLKTDATASAGPTDVVVPVCLRLDQVANHPLNSGLVAMPSSPTDATKSSSTDDEDAEQANLNPNQMMITNPSQVTVSVATVITTLLLTEDDLPPVNAALAAPTPSSLNLGPNGVVTIDLKAPASIPAWTSVAVEFDGITVKLDAEKVLNQIHQLASSSSFKTNLNVHCYALAHPESLPAQLSTLIGVHVQVQNNTGSSVQDIYVTREQPNPTVAIGYSLADILNGASLDQPKCQARCRNMTALGESGNWSEWQTNTGQDLFVAPVMSGS